MTTEPRTIEQRLGGEDAYPYPGTTRELPSRGLTKRELIAAMAMQGYCAEGVGGDAKVIAVASVMQADALLMELDR